MSWRGTLVVMSIVAVQSDAVLLFYLCLRCEILSSTVKVTGPDKPMIGDGFHRIHTVRFFQFLFQSCVHAIHRLPIGMCSLAGVVGMPGDLKAATRPLVGPLP